MGCFLLTGFLCFGFASSRDFSLYLQLVMLQWDWMIPMIFLDTILFSSRTIAEIVGGFLKDADFLSNFYLRFGFSVP